MQILGPRTGVLVRVLGERRKKGRTVHADRPVDAPRLDGNFDVGERAMPGVHV
jgi:hypothetical protein